MEIEKDLQKIMDSVGVYVFHYYPPEHLLQISDTLMEVFGVERFVEDVFPWIDEAIYSEDNRVKVRRFFEELDTCSEKSNISLISEKKLSSYRVKSCVLERDDTGKATHHMGIMLKVDDDVLSREIIYALSNNFSNIFLVDLEDDKVISLDLDRMKSRYFNFMSEKVPSYTKMIGKFVERFVYVEDREEVLQYASIDNIKKQLLLKGVFQFDFRTSLDGKKIFYYRARFADTKDCGNLRRIVVGFENITVEKSLEMNRLNYVDKVTLGDNYARFKDKLSDIDKDGYLISMDLHSFKVVNSICGSVRGDEALKETWRCVKESIGEEDLAAHVYGDHFVLFISGVDKLKSIRCIQSIVEKLEEISLKLEIPNLVPYFGITVWGETKKVEEALSEANFAKNQIKDRKDVCYVFYSREDTDRILEEKSLEDSFYSALKEEKFEVFYQPKFDPLSERFVGAEALVRWRRKDGSLISPSKFIPLFEKNGMIKDLDAYVFKKVCSDQVNWKKTGKAIIPVSINLSRASLYYDSLAKQYQQIIMESGLNPNMIPIEITESATIDNENIKTITTQLLEIGSPIQIDDFGAGYSALATLNMMCFETIKLDKSLIDCIGNERGEKLLSHIISFAKDFGLHVTAEGVETYDQVTFLRGMECDSIQGFFYSKPLPKEEFERILIGA